MRHHSHAHQNQWGFTWTRKRSIEALPIAAFRAETRENRTALYSSPPRLTCLSIYIPVRSNGLRPATRCPAPQANSVNLICHWPQRWISWLDSPPDPVVHTCFQIFNLWFDWKRVLYKNYAIFPSIGDANGHKDQQSGDDGEKDDKDGIPVGEWQSKMIWWREGKKCEKYIPRTGGQCEKSQPSQG